MKRFFSLSLIVTGLLMACELPTAQAGGPTYVARRRADRVAMYYAAAQPWHGEYYHTATGRPIPLVVPPTAHSQVEMGWGVTQTETRPITQQFMRPYPGEGGGGGNPLLPTPPWPSHTRQFGVYSVRGPW